MKKLNDVPKIQKGIEYAPFIDFYAFDILVDDEYLDVLSANEIFEKFGFFYAKPCLREILKFA